MAEISAALVKQLREMTGAGLMDCKKALTENNGDLEAAADWLRAKGILKAAKKADRVAAEGLVGLVVSGTSAAVVEVNSETDFVARNPEFQQAVRVIAVAALKAGGDVETMKASHIAGSAHAIAVEVANAVATIGENMNVRRTAAYTVNDGAIGSYLHNQIAPGLGKIGVLVALESSGDKEKLLALGKQIAMHIAAANPQALDISSVDPAALAREKAVLTEQAAGSGKPAAVIEKMVEGRVRKFYEETVLLEQVFVVDGESRVKDVIAKTAKELGVAVACTGFVRYGLGEGIEKKTEDFAAEVAAQLKS